MPELEIASGTTPFTWFSGSSVTAPSITVNSEWTWDNPPSQWKGMTYKFPYHPLGVVGWTRQEFLVVAESVCCSLVYRYVISVGYRGVNQEYHLWSIRDHLNAIHWFLEGSESLPDSGGDLLVLVRDNSLVKVPNQNHRSSRLRPLSDRNPHTVVSVSIAFTDTIWPVSGNPPNGFVHNIIGTIPRWYVPRGQIVYGTNDEVLRSRVGVQDFHELRFEFRDRSNGTRPGDLYVNNRKMEPVLICDLYGRKVYQVPFALLSTEYGALSYSQKTTLVAMYSGDPLQNDSVMYVDRFYEAVWIDVETRYDWCPTRPCRTACSMKAISAT